MGKPLVQATIVADIRSIEGQTAGAVEFREMNGVVCGIACRCPCGCGEEMWLPVRAKGAARTTRPEWEFNGDRERPVLKPSVFNTGLPCRWHGYLGRKQPGFWDQV